MPQQSYAKWQTDWQKSPALATLSLRTLDVLNQIDLSDIDRRNTMDAAKANSTGEALNKIRELYQHRSHAPWLFPLSEAYLVLRAGNTLPPEEHTQLIRDYISSAQNDPARRERGRAPAGP